METPASSEDGNDKILSDTVSAFTPDTDSVAALSSSMRDTGITVTHPDDIPLPNIRKLEGRSQWLSFKNEIIQSLSVSNSTGYLIGQIPPGGTELCDQHIKSWLYNSLSPTLQRSILQYLHPYVPKDHTTKDFWDALHAAYNGSCHKYQAFAKFMKLSRSDYSSVRDFTTALIHSLLCCWELGFKMDELAGIVKLVEELDAERPTWCDEVWEQTMDDDSYSFRELIQQANDGVLSIAELPTKSPADTTTESTPYSNDNKCSHCEGAHKINRCWYLHPNQRPKKWIPKRGIYAVPAKG
ncbi:uncharacterized protein K452DRAFT_315941 [Aplosporella prunicola CBS 121167]|uniref:Uncharacterized protein n=1 Tax=Aplosporella prunicola CBS 121167 TaxID=1176127 RepID=A0A6A6BRB1_9PEZI|nr:uncharacterized protein K452DRAFT_315941 [Aplosporella prunicola CBS 121167]KAF2145774.1 hypothetical protein K452DRAFT_315941 [Aplosporella prunicola CBS 121167]